MNSSQAATLAGQGSGELMKESINRLQKSSLATSQYIEATRKLVSLLDSSKSVLKYKCNYLQEFALFLVIFTINFQIYY